MERSCRTVELSECLFLVERDREPKLTDVASDLFFPVEQLVSFLSQGTTLPAGTVIVTGTPAGVGAGKKPPQYLKSGDEFSVVITPHIGTLTTIYKNEE